MVFSHPVARCQTASMGFDSDTQPHNPRQTWTTRCAGRIDAADLRALQDRHAGAGGCRGGHRDRRGAGRHRPQCRAVERPADQDLGTPARHRQPQRACRPARRPTPALVAGSRMHISSYGMYGYALLCCATLRDVTQLAVKYHRLATPTVGMSFREEERRGGVVVRFHRGPRRRRPAVPLLRRVPVRHPHHAGQGPDGAGVQARRACAPAIRRRPTARRTASSCAARPSSTSR